MSATGGMGGRIERVDHLVYATPDVARSVDEIEALLGVRAGPGGRHPAWGTHNALIGLGERCYLEIVGPEPGAAAPSTARPFGLDGLAAGRLATWAAHAEALDRLTAGARAAGIDLGGAVARSRERPDGTLLRWTMTDSLAPRAGGVVPFFIDWGDAPHPAASAPPGGRLVALRAQHPDPDRTARMLRALGVAIEVEPGPSPGLIATIETERGRIELR